MRFSILPVLALPWLCAAADCSPETALIPYATQTWEVRQAVCGDIACAEQWALTGNQTSCEIQMELGGGWAITYWVADSNAVYSYCWDATENIIDQCFSGGEYNEDTTAFLGWWQLGTESYSIFIGKNEADIEPEVLDLDDGGQIVVEDPAPPVNTPTSERFLGRRK